MGYAGTFDFVPFFGDPRRMRGLHSISAQHLAPKQAWFMKPPLFLFPFLGTRESAGVTSQFRPTAGTQEDMGYEAASEFVPPFWGPPRTYQCRSIVASLRRQGF